MQIIFSQHCRNNPFWQYCGNTAKTIHKSSFGNITAILPENIINDQYCRSSGNNTYEIMAQKSLISVIEFTHDDVPVFPSPDYSIYFKNQNFKIKEAWYL